MLKHVVTREVIRLGQAVEEIARELPVCPDCKRQLDAGVSLSVLTEQHRPIAVPVALKLFQEAVAPAPPEPARVLSFGRSIKK